MTRCVPDDAVLDEALAIAGSWPGGAGPRCSGPSGRSISGCKAASAAFGESLALEMLGFLGPDAKEGVAALRDRRPPRFPSAAAPESQRRSRPDGEAAVRRR